MVNVGKFDGVANFDGAAIGFFFARYHLEQRRFTCAVGTNYPDDRAWRNRGRKPVENEAVAVALGHLVKFKNEITEAWTRRDVNIQFFAARFGFLTQ